jgi:hypothetical protein
MHAPAFFLVVLLSTASDRTPWWQPALFICLGAGLGFVSGRLANWFDDRKARKVFLKSVRAELAVARGHLEGTLRDATETKNKLEQGMGEALRMLAVFQTGVFSSQIGRLRSVFDPLVIEVIQFYDKLSNLERVMSRLTAISFELSRFTKEEADRLEAAAEDYRGTLDEVIRRVEQLLPDVEKLIRKLPEK